MIAIYKCLELNRHESATSETSGLASSMIVIKLRRLGQYIGMFIHYIYYLLDWVNRPGFFALLSFQRVLDFYRFLFIQSANYKRELTKHIDGLMSQASPHVEIDKHVKDHHAELELQCETL